MALPHDLPTRTDAAMPSSHTPAPRCQWFSILAGALDRRSGRRLALLFLGVLLARGRQALSCWIRAAGLSSQYRRCYPTAAAVGRRAEAIATRLLVEVLRPLVTGPRVVLALDDTPTARYGSQVQGAGVHHNPTPGPAGSGFVYGHVWVVLGLLVAHPLGGVVALPLLARRYIRKANLGAVRAADRPPFATKLTMAVGLVRWAHGWLALWGKAVWVVADGAYAQGPVLKPLRKLGVTVVSRLRRDAALCSVPPARVPGRPGGRGCTGPSGCRWPSGPPTPAGGAPACSPCTGSRSRSGTRRSWPRGARPVGRSGWCWWTSPTDGSRSSAPTPPRPWPTSWSGWPTGSPWRPVFGISNKSPGRVSSRCAGCRRTWGASTCARGPTP
ncbi:transposase [Gemmata obscuriglobus]|uniref:IS701 family transposase n=2 Tax=Gemmata obscuriglobus TaxID=114 RepID=UPI0030B84F87